MENTLQPQNATMATIFSPESLLYHWHGHRNVTRRIIEAFPEDQLFSYSIGGMRPFAEMVKEILGISAAGVRGVATGEWTAVSELDYHSGKALASSKIELLAQWDEVTTTINTFWAQIPAQRFGEVINAFNQWEGEAYGIMMYWIDNEIHHRAQGYVYLRSLGIEPPAFWDRS